MTFPVTDLILLAVAIAAGRKLANRLFKAGLTSDRLDYENIPTVVFSHPPVGKGEMMTSSPKVKVTLGPIYFPPPPFRNYWINGSSG